MSKLKLTSLFFFGFVLAVQTAWSRPFCTAKDVHGTYAFQADGTVLDPPVNGPFMRLGWFNANGSGGITGSTLAVYNGFNFGVESITGTYTVTNDCAIVLTLAIPAPLFANATFKGRVANDGEDIMFMLMSTDSPIFPLPTTTVLGHGRRRKLNTCSIRDLNGAYRFEVNGSANIPFPFADSPAPPATLVRLLGQVKTDGGGMLSTSFIKSLNGIIGEEKNVTGTYTVNPDCTFKMSFTLGGAPMIMRGSLIGLGEEAFVVLNPDGLFVPDSLIGPFVFNGTVATGSMIQQSISNADR